MKTPSPHDDFLRTYVREEFVDSGFITVNQWRNFIDYLQILINKEKKETEIHCLQNELKFLENVPYSRVMGKEKEVDFEARRKEISARLTQLGGSS